MQTLYPLCSITLRRPAEEQEVDSQGGATALSFEYELHIQQVSFEHELHVQQRRPYVQRMRRWRGSLFAVNMCVAIPQYGSHAPALG